MVLMARRDLRFRLIFAFAHFTMFIFLYSLFYCLSGLTDRVFKNREVQIGHLDETPQLPSPYDAEGELVVSRGDDDDRV